MTPIATMDGWLDEACQLLGLPAVPGPDLRDRLLELARDGADALLGRSGHVAGERRLVQYDRDGRDGVSAGPSDIEEGDVARLALHG